MNALNGFSPLARKIVTAAGLAIVIIFLRMAESVIGPILLAGFIAVVATPMLRWLRGKRVSKWLALGIIMVILLDVGSIFALLFTGQLEGFRESFPTYQERVVVLSDQFCGWLEEDLGVSNGREAVRDIFDPSLAIGLVRVALSNVSGTFSTGMLVLLAVIFMLLEAPNLQRKLKVSFQLSEEAEASIHGMLTAINRYMVIKSLTSFATAFCLWVWLTILGIDFAVLWGLLAFLLNFVPFLGAILMAMPAVLMSLVQTDVQTTLLVVLGYIAVNAVIGSFLEPRIMGRGLGISPLAVFLSLQFWGWVLGTVGVFLSIPLTIVLISALEASPQTRPLAILLGPELPGDDDAHDEPGEVTPHGDDGVDDAVSRSGV